MVYLVNPIIRIMGEFTVKTRKVMSVGLPATKNMAVMAVSQFMGANYRVIKPEELHKTLGSLFGAVGVDENPGEYDIPGKELENGEMIIFAGFDGDDINVFLEKFRKMKVGTVLFKALLTEYNALWSPVFLYSELEKEQAEIDKSGK